MTLTFSTLDLNHEMIIIILRSFHVLVLIVAEQFWNRFRRDFSRFYTFLLTPENFQPFFCALLYLTKCLFQCWAHHRVSASCLWRIYNVYYQGYKCFSGIFRPRSHRIQINAQYFAYEHVFLVRSRHLVRSFT